MVVVPLVITLMIVLVSRPGWEIFGEFDHVFRFRSRRVTCRVSLLIAQPGAYHIEHVVDLHRTRLPPLDSQRAKEISIAPTTAGAGAP
ncbi:hypothetical protein EV363DRAFT_1156996 [Boletus edulis]|uniref:Secreted protein n=1 Tax=Boletus edulis BED1 TaxID=1328754 RepID=A0AAD4G8Q4_BOLED|nr:hypothetical protein EV363DRAFT_1156996 [Boletus edulis]KAF8430842.1 hypothetical protein L210DRAFT_980398 [Boletus edulis BED1]